MQDNIMHSYTAEEHSKRLFHIREAERGITSCAKRELLSHYEPGHYIYPLSAPGKPEEDEALFRRLKAGGASYIYIWSAWADEANRWNGDPMFVPKNPEEMKDFIDLVHRCGLKILPYTSTNFFNRDSEYFNPDWAYESKYDLILERKPDDPRPDIRLAHCSPTSPSWRAHLLRQYGNLLDMFDFDGVYIDSGYLRRCDYLSSQRYYEPEPVLVKDEILAFPETANCDGGMEDLLGLIYNEVKHRNKTVTVFKEGCDRFHTQNTVSDYMFAGECAKDIDFVRETIQSFPHVLLDFSPPEKIAEDEYYLNTIPFLHFPLLKQLAITVPDQNSIIPDFEYALRWLSLFREMTEDGTWCYGDTKCPSIVSGDMQNVVCTFYVNRESYLVLANFGKQTAKLLLTGKYREVQPGAGNGKVAGSLELHGREIKVLKRTDA